MSDVSQPHPRRKILGVVAAVVVGGPVLAFNVASDMGVLGGGSVDGARIERAVDDTMRNAGLTARSVECEDLDAEVGATARCEATTVNGTDLRARATTTSVEGRSVRYEVVPVQ